MGGNLYQMLIAICILVPAEIYFEDVSAVAVSEKSATNRRLQIFVAVA
jgi:hypothetical protein